MVRNYAKKVMEILQKPAKAEKIWHKRATLAKFAENLQKEESSTGTAGQTNRTAPAGPTEADVAYEGRGQSGGPLGWLHSGGARLSREKQGREALLGSLI